MKYADYIYYNIRLTTYGKSIVIPKHIFICMLCVFCIVTPATNWIPFYLHKKKKLNKIIIRW